MIFPGLQKRVTTVKISVIRFEKNFPVNYFRGFVFIVKNENKKGKACDSLWECASLSEKHAVNLHILTLIFKVIKKKFWNIKTKLAQ